MEASDAERKRKPPEAAGGSEEAAAGDEEDEERWVGPLPGEAAQAKRRRGNGRSGAFARPPLPGGEAGAGSRAAGRPAGRCGVSCRADRCPELCRRGAPPGCVLRRPAAPAAVRVPSWRCQREFGGVKQARTGPLGSGCRCAGIGGWGAKIGDENRKSDGFGRAS